MGICEILTIIFVVCKIIGIISWSWLFVLLPEIIAFVFYAVMVLLTILGAFRINKRFKD